MKSLTNYIIESQKLKLYSDAKEHGFEYVDLGLPSGTMWATCNVGADKPENPGLLFQFGLIDGYKYDSKNNKFYTADQNIKQTGDFHIPSPKSGKKYVDGDTLDLVDDAANVNMGGKWRMPTKTQLKELLRYTTQTIEKRDNITGMLFVSKQNNKQMFIPYGGYWSDTFGDKYFKDVLKLWSSDVYDNNYHDEENTTAWVLVDDELTNDYRALACSVRGVFKK